MCQLGRNTTEPTKVSSLQLVIPIKSKHMKLRHWHGHHVKKDQSTIHQKDGWEWWGSSYRKFLWVGDEDLGLKWFAEKDIPWPHREPAGLAVARRFMNIKYEGDTTVCRFVYIDAPRVLKTAKTITFGLQATPIKPLAPRWRSLGIERSGTLIFSGRKQLTYKHWAYPVLKDVDIARASMKQIRKRYEQFGIFNVPISPYVGVQAHDSASPEYKKYGRSWGVVIRKGNDSPDKAPYVRPYGKGGEFATRNANICMGAKDYRDFITYKVRKLIKDLDLQGIYLDHSRPWRCMNGRHGCENDLRILAMRDVYRRLYTLLRQHSKGKQTWMVEHILESLCTPVVAWGDAYTTCEVVKLYPPEYDYLSKVDLDYFRSYCMGRQFGFVPFLEPGFRGEWSKMSRAYRDRMWAAKMAKLGLKPGTKTKLKKRWLWHPDVTEGTERLWAILLLLDMTTVWDCWNDCRINRRIWKILDDYGISTDDAVGFLPYWNNAKYVGATFKQKATGEEYPEPLVSIYNRRARCALVAVANLTLKDRDVRVELDLDALGLRGMKAVDAYYEPPLTILNGPNYSASSIELDNPYKGVPVRVERGTMVLPVKARKFRLIGIKHVGG